MNTEIARAIVNRIAHLAELAAIFTATYGANYHLVEDSPQKAWELYRLVMAEQAEIARLLDPEALNSSYSRYGAWWKRMDVPDCAIVNEMASEAFNLVSRCGYQEANRSAHWSHHDLVLQRSLAGFLHPSTRQTEVEHAERLLVGV